MPRQVGQQQWGSRQQWGGAAEGQAAVGLQAGRGCTLTAGTRVHWQGGAGTLDHRRLRTASSWPTALALLTSVPCS